MIATGLALALALVATACPKKSSPTPGGGTSQASASTPDFEWGVGRVLGVSSTPTQVKGISKKAKPVAEDVAKFMADVYKAQFLDPANWQDGSYDSAWKFYDQKAVPDAKKQVETLTLGTKAGDQFESVDPAQECQNMPVKVLLDSKNKATQVVAIVTFTAKAKASDGSSKTIVSQGQYFLQPDGGSWKIYAFSVSKDDSGAGPTGPAGPSGDKGKKAAPAQVAAGSSETSGCNKAGTATSGATP